MLEAPFGNETSGRLTRIETRHTCRSPNALHFGLAGYESVLDAVDGKAEVTDEELWRGCAGAVKALCE